MKIPVISKAKAQTLGGANPPQGPRALPPSGAGKPDEADMMMALATMHKLGRLGNGAGNS